LVADRVIQFRCESELFEALDAAAKAQGMSRSALLKQLVSAHVGTAPEQTFEPRYGDDDDRKLVSVRLNRRERSALEAGAKSLGVGRSQMLRMLIHARFYDGEKLVVLSPDTRSQISQNVAQLRAIGRSVNRIVPAVLGAIQDNKLEQLEGLSGDLLAARENILAAIKKTDTLMRDTHAEEHAFWRGDDTEFALRKKYRRKRKGS